MLLREGAPQCRPDRSILPPRRTSNEQTQEFPKHRSASSMGSWCSPSIVPYPTQMTPHAMPLAQLAKEPTQRPLNRAGRGDHRHHRKIQQGWRTSRTARIGAGTHVRQIRADEESGTRSLYCLPSSCQGRRSRCRTWGQNARKNRMGRGRMVNQRCGCSLHLFFLE